jgi:hypothetical protein
MDAPPSQGTRVRVASRGKANQNYTPNTQAPNKSQKFSNSGINNIVSNNGYSPDVLLSKNSRATA